MPFFEALVDRFYEGVAADPVLLRLYPEPDDLTAARHHLTLFLAQYWGGPSTYSEERGHPRLAHASRAVRDRARGAGPLARAHAGGARRPRTRARGAREASTSTSGSPPSRCGTGTSERRPRRRERARPHRRSDVAPTPRRSRCPGARSRPWAPTTTSRALIGSGTEVIDARGATVLPGFIDAHNHVRLGSNPGAVSLFGATSVQEIRDRIDAFADAHPEAAWIEGEGWNYAAIPGGAPTADLLEGCGRGKRPVPVLLRRAHGVAEPRGAALGSRSRATPCTCRGEPSRWIRSPVSRPATCTTSRCSASARKGSARSSRTSPATRPTRSTSGSSRRSTWRSASASPRSWSRRTAWTTSPCSSARATRARSGPG